MSHRKLLVPHGDGHVGLVQVERVVYVLSPCCGADLDRERSNKDGTPCMSCGTYIGHPVVPNIPPDEAHTSRLSTWIALDQVLTQYFPWWARGWTQLELEVEVVWL